MSETRPPKPPIGDFQTVEWDDELGEWRVRDLTDKEQSRKFDQPYPTWVWDETTGEWVPPTPKPDADAEWDEDTHAWTPGETVLANRARNQREELLKETDWTQLRDIAFPLETLNAWEGYRQALRDITKQDGFPYDITWPTPPGDPVEGD